MNEERILNQIGYYIADRNLFEKHQDMVIFFREIENITRSDFFTSYVSWADANGTIRVSGKGAIIPLKEDKNIRGRSYYKKSPIQQ